MIKSYVFLFLLYGSSLLSPAYSSEYGYDSIKKEIFYKGNNGMASIPFEQDYTVNPEVFFGYFAGSPSIVLMNRSLHDYTAYLGLSYMNDNFTIRCFHYFIKSKVNGISVKEGRCGASLVTPENLVEYIQEKMNDIELNIDSNDTSIFMDEQVKYFPVIMYRKKDELVYQVYKSKRDFLDDKYTIIYEKKGQVCKFYENNPWLVIDGDMINVMSEYYINGNVKLKHLKSSYQKSKECNIYPPFKIKNKKSLFHNSELKKENRYLVKGDAVNLKRVMENGKWCEIRYFDKDGKKVDAIVTCSDLSI